MIAAAHAEAVGSAFVLHENVRQIAATCYPEENFSIAGEMRTPNCSHQMTTLP